MKYAITIFALSLSLALTGCGSDGGGTGGGTGGGIGGGGGGGGTGDAGGGGTADTGGGGGGTTSPGCGLTAPVEPLEPEASCDDPSCPCGTVVSQVTGLVVDTSGAGISGAKAQICSRSARDGSTVCLAPVDTAADGSFFLSVPDDNNCMYESVMRALVPNKAFSTSYCTITGDDLVAPDGVLDLSGTPTVLHALTPAADAPDYVLDDMGNDDWDATYTVVFEDGLEIDVVPSWYFNGAIGHKSMAATYIEGTDHLCNAHEIEGAPGTWSISPEGDVFQMNYAARIPDKLGLPDGTEVDLYIQGGIGHTLWDGDDKAECREAEWRHFACATVENGVITLEGGTGLPSIGWLTYVPSE